MKNDKPIEIGSDLLKNTNYKHVITEYFAITQSGDIINTSRKFCNVNSKLLTTDNIRKIIKPTIGNDYDHLFVLTRDNNCFAINIIDNNLIKNFFSFPIKKIRVSESLIFILDTRKILHMAKINELSDNSNRFEIVTRFGERITDFDVTHDRLYVISDKNIFIAEVKPPLYRIR